MTSQQQRLVILGAGTGGTLAANRLRKKFPDDRLRIDIVDQDNVHVIAEFIEMIHDTGAGLYACLASVELFGMEREDLIDELDGIITIGEFYEMAAGGQIIFT